MMRALLLVFCSLSAWADASIAEGGARCSMNDAPYLEKERAFGKSNPGLAFRDARDGYVLYSSDELRPHSVLIDPQGSSRLFGPTLTQLVSVEHEQVLALDDHQLSLFDLAGHLRWRRPLADFGDSAATLVAGDLLIVSVFHRIATGASLFAVERTTGKPRWRAEVAQLAVGHSKYFNDVTLARAGDTVVMRGYEAAGCYTQVFELATGKRISAQLPK